MLFETYEITVYHCCVLEDDARIFYIIRSPWHKCIHFGWTGPVRHAKHCVTGEGGWESLINRNINS